MAYNFVFEADAVKQRWPSGFCSCPAPLNRGLMRIREATAEDAAAVIALFQQLYSETRFLLYEPGESVPGIEEYTRRITDTVTEKMESCCLRILTLASLA